MTEPVVRLVPDPPEPPPTLGVVDTLRGRFSGDYELDPWGLDAAFTRLAGRLASLRWRATVTGIGNLPVEGPALLVANRRLGWSEPAVVASAVTERTGRIVRPVGGIDVDPVGGLLRRLGALPARPDEVAAALRAGNLVLVPTRREPLRTRPGHLPVELLAPAVAAGVPLVPVAVVGWEPGWRWTVQIGEPVVAENLTKRRRRSDPETRADARAVGRAAVRVSTALETMLTDSFERGLGGRILSFLPPFRHDAVPGEGT